MNPAHLNDVTSLHLWAFRDHLNVLLGRKYNFRFLQWFVEHRNTIRLIGLLDEKPEGYVVGAEWGYQNEMNRDLLWSMTSALITHPWIIFNRKILKNGWLRFRSILGFNRSLEAIQHKYEGRIVSLVGIGVSRKAQGSQLAGELMYAFLHEAKSRGFDFARLSVYEVNSRAIRFYEKNGWVAENNKNSDVVGYYFNLNQI